VPNYAEIERQADGLRQQLKLGYGPIPDTSSLLRQLGIKLVLKRLGVRGPDGMYVRRGAVGFVLLNSSRYLPRLRFTSAHESGHHVLGHQVAVDQNIWGESRTDPQEQAANSFAAALLVPKRALEDRKAEYPRIDAVWVFDFATEFGVSYETVVYRLHNCGLLSGYQHRDALKSERIAVVPESLEMAAPPERTVLPTEYVRWAVAAYLDGKITLERLAELIEVDAEELDRQFSEGAVEHDDETA
jgi:Zn-dependent peptidase ImmA (M78 family)